MSGHRPDPDLQRSLEASATRAARVAPALVADTPPRRFIVHNVNFPYPCDNDTTMRRTVPARVIVPGLFGPADDDGSHRFIFNLGNDISPEEPLTDRFAIENGMISHTVLDYSALGTTGFQP